MHASWPKEVQENRHPMHDCYLIALARIPFIAVEYNSIARVMLV